MNYSCYRLTLSAGVLLLLIGCNGPAEVPELSVDPASATEAAFEMYDANSDQALSKKELASCASLTKSFKKIDKDNSGTLSNEELQTAIENQVNSSVRMVTLRVKVTLDGKPLTGGTVSAVPEPFLGANTIQASGDVLSDGIAFLVLPRDQMPEDLKNATGVQLGFYRLEVKHPSKSIPEKYNTKTIYGIEVTPQTEADLVKLNLKS